MTDMAPLFSCVIPTHGRPHLLRDAIRSVLVQEDAARLIGSVVIVIDDDNPESRKVVEELALEQPTISVTAVSSDREPRGAAQSRNRGAEESSDPYIAFLDDDDLWLPNHLSLAAARLRTDGEAAAIVSSRRTDDWKGATHTQPPLDKNLVSLDHAFAAGSVVTGSNLIVARSVFDSLGGYDPHLPVMNDTDFFVRLLFAGHVPLINPDVTVVMRIHEGDQLTRPNARRARGMRAFLAKHESVMSRAQRRNFKYRMWGMHRLSETSRLRRMGYAVIQLCNAQPRRVLRRRGASA